MRLFAITVEALSPLAFPARKPGAQFRASMPYVPGGAIYGALGQRLRPQQPDQLALFRAIRCHNAYPAWEGDGWSRPLPRTAERPRGADAAPPIDTLVERVCWEQLRPPALIFSPGDAHGRAWEADAGFHAPAPPAERDLRRQTRRKVQQRALTRVGISRRRGTAEDGQLYSPLVLSEVTTRRVYRWGDQPAERELAVRSDSPSRFMGSLAAPDDYDPAADLRAIGHIGGRTTTGLGQVRLQASPLPAERGEDVRARVAELTRLFRTRAAIDRALGGAGWQLAESAALFTVDLLSDAILLEQGWRPTMVLTAEMLREAAGLTSRVELLRAFAGYGYTGGWHVTWDAPKPSAVCTLMGGVFVFQAPDGLTADEYERLADLQLDGLGERRPEGYGQARVCDEFHVQAAFGVG